MRNNGGSGIWIGILTGIITSIIADFILRYLLRDNASSIYLISTILLFSAVGALAYAFRGKWYLLTKSGILGFFPEGQKQCEQLIVSELQKSKRAIFIGARGMDLVGESSPFSEALRRTKDAEDIEVFLLTPGGKNARLRGQALEVEKRKYQAEGEAVVNFLAMLALRHNLPIHTYLYAEKPLVRLIQTDRSIWFSFYRSGSRGRELPIFQISVKSAVAREIERLIDALRSSSQLRVYSDEGCEQLDRQDNL